MYDSIHTSWITGALTFPERAEDLGYLAPLRLDYIGNTISGPQDIQTVVTRDTDFGAAFNGAIIQADCCGCSRALDHRRVCH